MAGSDTPELLNLGEVCEIFGLEDRWVRRQVKRHGFPPPRRIDSEDCWEATEAWVWLAGVHPDLAEVAPLRYWSGQVEYHGVREIAGAAVQDWSVEGVRLRLVWKLPPLRHVLFDEAAALWPMVRRVVKIDGQVSRSGPVLFVHDEHGDRVGEWRWSDLARVLGGAAPYWPPVLRVPEVMRRWRPGTTDVVAAVPEIDAGPILRLAAALDPSFPAHQVLVELVQRVQARATRDAHSDIRSVVEDERAQWLQLAAEPMPTPEPASLSDAVCRAGWLEVLSRADSLAKTAVREVVAWNGGDSLPYGCRENIAPHDVVAAEWAIRLEPVSRLTAAFELVLDDEQDKVAAFLTDPVTDAPVVRLRSGELRTVSPWRLPTTARLAEVILGQQIWIRDAAGSLFLAPQISGYGLSYGYDGAHTLPVLIDRLLDDINAPAADAYYGASTGLEALIAKKWPAGTVLTRSELERARGRTGLV
ncbi:helix-turn-helix transcriptional regulator [Nocardia pseudovaccinii]|uniref:helix-turn-helix transcriptional regulator n=1 Tax=Nocardia pseudovaccinii TaxID=189540 RepID=UPI0007A528A8|nr:hypothetical protein [Nocardia pseudovaccinii]